MASSTSTAVQPQPEARGGDVEARVVRKVARRLIPFLALLYLVNYLDRTNIGFAKLTMSKDLGLSETAFGLASGLFFVGYLLFEVPSNLALQRFGARRWMARIMVSWGVVAAAMAVVQGTSSLYALRVLLGVAEAGFFPGVMLYLTLWFPRAYRVRLIGLFLLALPVSAALGAPLSALVVQHANGFLGLEGWRVMYLVEGVPALLLGVATWFCLTDRPAEATWLTAEERTWLTDTLAAELRGHETAAHAPAALRATFTDARVWALGVVYFGITYGLYALSFFLPTIVAGFKKQFGVSFSIVQTGLIVAVPFAVGAVCMVLWSRHSDRTGERTWHVAAPALLGAASVPLALYLNSPATVMLAISITAIGVFCALPVFWYLPTTFLRGTTAAAGIALVNTLGNLSGFGAPYVTGWLLDWTGSARAGLWVVGAVMLLAAGLVLALRTSLGAAPPLEHQRRATSGLTSSATSAAPSAEPVR